MTDLELALNDLVRLGILIDMPTIEPHERDNDVGYFVNKCLYAY